MAWWCVKKKIFGLLANSADPDQIMISSNLGPVVQSIVSLMSSFMTNSISVVVKVFSDTLIFFAAKMWVAFAKATHIFSAKNINVFAIFQDWNCNVRLANTFVKFWLNGPWSRLFTAYLFSYWSNNVRKCNFRDVASKDSDQSALLHSLIRIFSGHILASQGCKVSSCNQQRLIWLHRCTGWFESSLGTHTKRYVFSCWGSFSLYTWHYEPSILLHP